MTTLALVFVLCLTILALGILAGLRLAVVLAEQRRNRRPGFIDLTGMQ